MTLLEFVIKNDEDIPKLMKSWIKYYDTAEDAIFDGYCPSAFKILKETEYVKPRKRVRGTEESQCAYESSEDSERTECRKCWNRKVLISK